MSNVSYSNHFYTKIFTSGLGAMALRREDNPCYPLSVEDPVPSKYKRLQLLLQNQGTEDAINISFGDLNGISIKLYAGQSINFENYNGPVVADGYVNLFIGEAFA